MGVWQSCSGWWVILGFCGTMPQDSRIHVCPLTYWYTILIKFTQCCTVSCTVSVKSTNSYLASNIHSFFKTLDLQTYHDISYQWKHTVEKKPPRANSRAVAELQENRELCALRAKAFPIFGKDWELHCCSMLFMCGFQDGQFWSKSKYFVSIRKHERTNDKFAGLVCWVLLNYCSLLPTQCCISCHFQLRNGSPHVGLWIVGA